MSITDKNEAITVCQATQHAMLIPWGRFSRQLGLGERWRAAVVLSRYQDATPGGDLILEFGLASLAGYEYLQDLNLGPHPLAGEQAVQDAWDIEFRHYTTVSRFLYEVDETLVEQVQAELDAIMQPYIRSAVREVLCRQEHLTLCGDLTGRPVSAYSTTYPPDTVFGYMANQLRKGHQAALVTFKGIRHRAHVTTFHHSGDTVSSVCLREMVEATEARLGCRPRRRTDLLRQRIAAIETKMAQKQGWGETHRFTHVLQQVATQVRVAARTSAMVLTNTQGQMLVFDADGPYPGVQIRIDRPFAYQFPMPLFQVWQQLWPVSSESVKEQLATIVANQNLYSPTGIPIRLPWAALPEKIPKSRVLQRLVL